ncbi:hypothetical protein RJ55_08326 [Drechmeria coniospora]|nr:hypothetical protein RJ55_08326 [Drechmeria coniospora]
MRTSSLLLLGHAILGIPHAAASVVRVPDGHTPVVEKLPDVWALHDEAATSYDSAKVAAKVKPLHRRTHGADNDGFDHEEEDTASTSTADQRWFPPVVLIDWLIENDAPADCFFVSCARLLNATVEEAAVAAGFPAPRRGGPGMSRDDVLLAIERLGLSLRIYTIRGRGQVQAPGPDRFPHCVWYGRAFPRGRRRLRRLVAVTYLPRGSQTLHVVIGRNVGTPYATFTDFQADPNGVDVTREVTRSWICEYIYVDWSSSQGEFVRSRIQGVRQMLRAAREEARILALSTTTHEPMDTHEANHGHAEEPMNTDSGENRGDTDEPMDTREASHGRTEEAMEINAEHGGRTDEPMETDGGGHGQTSTPTEGPMDIPGVAFDPDSGRVDLGSLDENTYNRILRNSLSEFQCSSLLSLGLGLAFQRRPRSILGAPRPPDGGQKEVHRCAQLQSIVKPFSDLSAICGKITTLDFDFALSNHWAAGTWDYIQATLAGPAGSHTVPVTYNPDRNFSTSISIDLKSAFDSNAIDLDGIQYVTLAASGKFFKLFGGQFNDAWEVQRITLRAQCITPGFEVRSDILFTNTWYQHPGGWGRAPFRWADVGTIPVNRTDWVMTPCGTIDTLEYEFKIANEILAGTGDALFFTFQKGNAKNKTKVALGEGESLDAGYVQRGTVNLKDMFGTQTVDIRRMEEISILEEYRHYRRDQWRFQGITFTATCAGTSTKMKLTKFEKVPYQWLGHDKTMEVVWTGEVFVADWNNKAPTVSHSLFSKIVYDVKSPMMENIAPDMPTCRRWSCDPSHH